MQLKVLKLLLNEGATVDLIDNAGVTPLFLAACALIQRHFVANQRHFTANQRHFTANQRRSPCVLPFVALTRCWCGDAHVLQMPASTGASVRRRLRACIAVALLRRCQCAAFHSPCLSLRSTALMSLPLAAFRLPPLSFLLSPSFLIKVTARQRSFPCPFRCIPTVLISWFSLPANR